ncbi:aldehyde dehydrogenase family protein [Streptomyces silvisoli]|uniref:Aldehyde dehydrogenase family protein n=1 Tax=Streptomyces silvisoli TaxID=3034235 RepID=A0ABT5ZDC9_9ACTN|nr:aldehyde dehydrogenase family protein [Streptomyces silvisoli]MDF3287817.1 aldehyde dehydrogenase family protein [Streptomyces silvisoli]
MDPRLKPRELLDPRTEFAPAVVVTTTALTELFEPEWVIAVQRFLSEEDAVRAANAVVLGLASAMWTADHARAVRLPHRLAPGRVRVNTHFTFPSDMPHGGFKHSGYGKVLSSYGLEGYTRINASCARPGRRGETAAATPPYGAMCGCRRYAR